MGLREKVALSIAVITLLQITLVLCSHSGETQNKDSNKQKQKRNLDTATQPPVVVTLRPYILDPKTRSQQSAEKIHESIRKTFNFPDVDYPTASTPRPPYYLQKTNILERNPNKRTAEHPSSTTAPYPINSNRISMKYNNKKYAKFKSQQRPGITSTFPEFGTTPKPFNFREEGAFPEVEYPLSAKDIWKPNYWNQFAIAEPKNEINYNGPNSITQVETNVKSSSASSSKNSIKMKINTAATPNLKSSKSINSNYMNTTPAPTLESTSTSTTPFVLTPYTTLYFDTSPSYIDTRTDDKENATRPVKKVSKKKKTKKKSSKSEGLLTPTETITTKDEDYSNSTIYCMETTTLTNETIQVTNTQENHFTIMPDDHISEDKLSNFDTCSNIINDTLPYMYVLTTTPSYDLCSGDVTTVSPLTIYNDDKIPSVPCDINNASIADVINTIVSENRDNKESCFEDNARTSNKSSTCDDNISISPLSTREEANDLPTDDREFTTDGFPDIDENILSMLKTITSTLSPINLVAIDEAWDNTDVIDPYKSLAYPDELEQYYIAVP